jgi:hypothetical protein
MRGVQYRNQVGDAGAMAIGEALKVNSRVQELDLVRFLYGLCVGYVVELFL